MDGTIALPVHSAELGRVLHHVAAQGTGNPNAARLLGWTHLKQTTSFPCYVLWMETVEGCELALFLKDYARSRLPKADLPRRIERELRVYQDLITGANLGTAAYYGAELDRQSAFAWLLLEYIRGVELRSCGFAAYVHVAAWLGKFHAYFGLHPQKLDRASYLVSHDKSFFADRAHSALQAVCKYGTDLAQRLYKVLNDYDDLIDRMVAQPRTLVHGSFRPQNILLVEQEPTWRVCPVDWELAGLGSPFYDLAFLTDGFHGAELKMLLDTYDHESATYGMPITDRATMLEIVRCFRLHKMIKSLSDSAGLNFPLPSVEKILVLAEEIHRDYESETTARPPNQQP